MRRADGPRCRHCWLPSPAPACDACRSRPLSVRELRSGFVYDGPTRAAVLALKHRAVNDIAPLLVERSARIEPAGDIDLVVPIPIPLLRRRRRGGNQAERLASVISERSGLQLDSRAIRRRGWWSPRQAQARSRGERLRLVEDAFIVEPARVRGRGILLVDDVTTTMASLSEAARVLRAAGARAVDAWTVARTE